MFSCSLYKGGVLLTMSLVYFSVVKKVIATQLLIMIVTGSYAIFRKELLLSICKTLRVYGVHKDVTQYSPVLQRFSGKTNESSLALIFSYS